MPQCGIYEIGKRALARGRNVPNSLSVDHLIYKYNGFWLDGGKLNDWRCLENIVPFHTQK